MNWDKYLRPQPDGADVDIFFKLLKDKHGHKRRKPKKPYAGMGDLYSAKKAKYMTVLTRRKKELKQQEGPIEEALELSGFKPMVVGMMEYFMPIMNRGIDNSGIGCSCGINGNPPWSHEKDTNITILASIDSASGCMEGIIHELGHAKFHALGIHLEEYPKELIGNPLDEVYPSPVRFDKLRPMSAVMHAEFSYIYVTQYYLPLIAKAREEGKALYTSLDPLLSRQAYNLKRIGNGIHTIREDFIPGNEEFHAALIDFAMEVWYKAFEDFKGVEDDFDWSPVKGKP